MEENSNRRHAAKNITVNQILLLLKKILSYLKYLRYINPLTYIKRLDRYIIVKFIGTYFFAIFLIISIAIVFDFNENLSKFTEYHAPWKAIVFDYYMNFVPYFANLFYVKVISSFFLLSESILIILLFVASKKVLF